MMHGLEHATAAFRTLAVVAAVSASGACLGTPVYRAVDLGFMPEARETRLYDFNERNEGLGTSGDYAVAWRPGKGLVAYADLDPSDGAAFFWRLNSRREAAGDAESPDGTTIEAVFSTPQGKRLYFLRGTWAEAGFGRGQWPPIQDLSDSGDVLGISDAPWLWSAAAGLRRIGHDGGYYVVDRVNNHGQVVGARDVENDSVDCYGSRAFVYDDPTGRFLAIDGGPPDIDVDLCARWSEATAINDAGQAVGYSDWDGGADLHGNFAFVWSRETGQRFIPNDDPTRNDFIPAAINRHGQVVGTFQNGVGTPLRQPRRFFYWEPGTGLVDLQNLLDTADPASAQVGLRTDGDDIQINDRGVISLRGRLTGDSRWHWFLLYPQ